MMIKPVELTDTIALMNSGDFKDRFRAEYYQLTIRLGKLENMLAKMKADTLKFIPSCSYELLYEQVIFMKQYKHILEERAKIESVDLGSDE